MVTNGRWRRSRRGIGSSPWRSPSSCTDRRTDCGIASASSAASSGKSTGRSMEETTARQIVSIVCDFPRPRTMRARPSESPSGYSVTSARTRSPASAEKSGGRSASRSRSESRSRKRTKERFPAGAYLPDERPDPAVDDPLDPSVRRSAAALPLDPHPHPVPGPRPGKGMPRDADDGNVRILRDHDRAPFPGDAQPPFDRPFAAPLPCPACRRRVPRRPAGCFPLPRRGGFPGFFPGSAVRIHGFEGGLEGAALPFFHAGRPEPLLDGGMPLPEIRPVLPDPPLPVRPGRAFRRVSFPVSLPS